MEYSFRIHHLEQSDECEDTGNTCIDFVRLDFPSYNTDRVTCGSKEKLNTTMGLDGMNKLDVEFATNRRTQRPGVEMMVYCRDPALDAHYNSNRARRIAEGCTLPNGFGPRDEPFDPPSVSHIFTQAYFDVGMFKHRRKGYAIFLLVVKEVDCLVCWRSVRACPISITQWYSPMEPATQTSPA